MLGAIFGDIAGSIYEFNNIKTTTFELLSKKSEYTDDSILTIAVADWVLSENLSKENLIKIICRYVKKYPHPMGSYGCRFSEWIYGDTTKPYNSWGNGSAMRVASIGRAFPTLIKTEEIAKLSAEITHNHPEGVKGAQATAAAIYLARTGSSKKEIKSYIEKTYKYDLDKTCDEIRPTYTFNESCQQTVPEAIIAFLDSTDFESAIRLAVSLGGDSDTLTCITGGIAEAFYGMCNNNSPSSDAEGQFSQFQKQAMEKLPKELSAVVIRFYQRFIIPAERG